MDGLSKNVILGSKEIKNTFYLFIFNVRSELIDTFWNMLTADNLVASRYLRHKRLIPWQGSSHCHRPSPPNSKLSSQRKNCWQLCSGMQKVCCLWTPYRNVRQLPVKLWTDRQVVFQSKEIVIYPPYNLHFLPPLFIHIPHFITVLIVTFYLEWLSSPVSIEP